MNQDFLQRLYKKLSSQDFANPDTGNLSFPSYTCMYDPEYEHEMSSLLDKLARQLIRPDHYVDTLVINVFEFFLDYLEQQSFGNKGSLLEMYKKTESVSPEHVRKLLAEQAQSDAFFQKLAGHIKTDFLEKTSETEKSYVFVHGFSTIYPYLRTKHFLIKMERYVQGYKLIVFYPGKASGHYSGPFSLFGKLKPEPYRPTKLIDIRDEN